MSAVRWLIRDPATNKALHRVYVTGKGWYKWNRAYEVYNSARNYEQLQCSDAHSVDFSKKIGVGDNDGNRS